MKTRRKHRKTTTGRRKRHVKHRVQTRINHRKGTVSSGRRHKFFKRGGQNPFGTATSRQYGTYYNGAYVASGSQNIADQKEREMAKAAAEAAAAAQEAAKIDYPDVLDFVQKTNAMFTSTYIDDRNAKLTIQKLKQENFSYMNVQNGNAQSPVIKTINNKTVKFYISHNGCNFYIYVDNTLYGRVQIITTDGSVIDTESICNGKLVDAIRTDLLFKASSAT